MHIFSALSSDQFKHIDGLVQDCSNHWLRTSYIRQIISQELVQSSDYLNVINLALQTWVKDFILWSTN